MNKAIYKSKNVLDENGEKFTLFYYLLSKKAEKIEDGISTVYGVEVTKYKDGIFLEGNKIDGISCNKEEVLKFIMDIANGNVTPVVLTELADDFISQLI